MTITQKQRQNSQKKTEKKEKNNANHMTKLE